jgi:hypothetical protein
MKTIRLYDKEFKFLISHSKVVIRRPEWNTKRHLYGVEGDTVKLISRYGNLIGLSRIEKQKHLRFKTCWVMMLTRATA